MVFLWDFIGFLGDFCGILWDLMGFYGISMGFYRISRGFLWDSMLEYGRGPKNEATQKWFVRENPFTNG